MKKLLAQNKFRIIAARWYKLNDQVAAISIKKYLEQWGFEVFIGVKNRVYATKGY